MATQQRINFASAYLKSQILKSPWFIHKQAVRGQLKLVHDFLNENLIIDESEEPQLTQPYTIRLTHTNSDIQDRNISVIPVNGSLMKYDYCGAPGMQSIANRIKQAEQSESVSGIILNIDSPGGTVDGTQELGDVVRNCSKPILAFADGLMASAAYWVGSSADMVIAKDSTTEIGSIGVVMSFMDNQAALEEKGFKFHDIFADQSDEKWKEMLDAQKGDYSTIKEWTLNPLAAEFQETVKSNRPDVKDKALKGRVFLAKQAKKMGLIDSIGNFDFAVKEINKLISNKYKGIMTEDNKEVIENASKDKVIEMTIPKDEKGFFEKLGSYIKPEIKDISEETKADYEKNISNANLKIEAQEKEISELKTNAENAAIELCKIEDNAVIVNEENIALKAEITEAKTELTKEVAKPTLVESEDDKLEIGKLSEQEESWIKDASSFVGKL